MRRCGSRLNPTFAPFVLVAGFASPGALGGPENPFGGVIVQQSERGVAPSP